MLVPSPRLFGLLILLMIPSATPAAEIPTPDQRRRLAQDFHLRAQERTGILVPMYVYPENIHKNAAYNRLMDLKRRYETVPIWVIVNPASGPGKAVDPNYVKAIDRLRGAGCVVLGYVSTNYGKRSPDEVRKDLDLWRKFYPATHGLFYDEMINEDTDKGVKHQLALKQAADEAGFWPIVTNPGTETPGRYFAAGVADVVIVHESATWPKEERLKGDYFGGNADYPPFQRGALLHSQPALNADSLRMIRRYARWVYVTDDPYRADDPAAPNPWDTLSKHMEEMCEQLAR